ncbi:MAG: GIY-YIG nuclease family protein [Oscillospiraceae bacterium]|nr:GIY-YIG nuclease family protein [Bacillota bacterium]MBR3584901.1 GIY-YIG nuclease family protein [Oscillospiraceae bacterium]
MAIKNCIYIITHPQYPGYVKIGYASDLKQRLSTLNTGVISNYIPYAVYETPIQNADREIHDIIKLLNPILRASTFDKGKVKAKEFFRLEPEEAFQLLQHIAKASGTENKVYKVTSDCKPIASKTAVPSGAQPASASGSAGNSKQNEPANNSSKATVSTSDICVIPNGTYNLERKVRGWENQTVRATLKVEDGKYILLKGSTICPIVKDSMGEGTKKIRSTASINNNELTSDLVVSSVSQASSLAVGSACDGWETWKTEDGEPIDVFRAKASGQ